jgi:hypothetical protein
MSRAWFRESKRFLWLPIAALVPVGFASCAEGASVDDSSPGTAAAGGFGGSGASDASHASGGTSGSTTGGAAGADSGGTSGSGGTIEIDSGDAAEDALDDAPQESGDSEAEAAAPTCNDGVQNQGETGVDCGGPCPACPPSCSDGVQNQGETGVDCGGPCPPCAGTCVDGVQNQGETGVDCGGPCPPCPTCTDGVQNQGEQGIDCGGPCPHACPTCVDGVQNQGEIGVDCGGPCPPCPTCTDGVQNQGEQGIDCGGPCPNACPTCHDGIQNQGETGVDCGGPCAPCGFLHSENFNAYPAWGPDGAYTVSGVCNSVLQGWALDNAPNPHGWFSLGSGYYAIIDTDYIDYMGIGCDDYMMTPYLPTHGATQVTIAFKTSFRTFTDTLGEVILERDGVRQVVWSRTSNLQNASLSLGPFAVNGASQVRVLWHYVGSYQYYWMVDDIVVQGS